jgi:hypothetical protein
MNISIDLNLRQLKSAIVNSKSGAKCLLIPIVENQLVEGEKGIYLNATGFEIKNKSADQKNTHLVKQSFKKEVYDKMTDQEKQSQPILGNLTVWGTREAEPAQTIEEIDPIDSDGLPF